MNIVEKLSDLALNSLSQDSFDKLRAHYLITKGKCAPIFKMVYGTYSTEDLRQHLEQKIGSDFDILMVHSSINYMQPMYSGSPLELLNMLMEYCGSHKTLAMPAFFFGDPKIGSVSKTFRENPVFDLRRTPSQMGLMTELFRRTKGAVQSRHPVYRMTALGPLAKEMVSGHESSDAPAGLGSPFEFMVKNNTTVLGIGKSYHVLTQVHHVDALMGDDMPVELKPKEKRDEIHLKVKDGDELIPVTLRDNGIKWTCNMDRLPGLLNPGDLSTWKFHNTPLFSGNIKTITESLHASAKKGKTIYQP